MKQENVMHPILFSALVCAAIIIAYTLFTLATLPTSPVGFKSLLMNRGLYESVDRLMSTGWTRMLAPYGYEAGRVYWMPSTIFFVFFSEKYLGPLVSYLLFSEIFLVVSFALARAVTGSLCFAATLCFMFAFGTQLNYAYTYGSLIPLYLVLTYAAVNFSIGFLLVSGRLESRLWMAAFGLSMCILALSTEWWINYVVAVIAAAGFGILWARHHGNEFTTRRLRFIFLASIGILIVYLIIRLQYPGQFIQSGAEEELLFKYRYGILMVEDAIVNFFTLLYTSVTNYSPSFITSSNSLSYLGPQKIIEQQQGYDVLHQQLVVMSHVFMWRFYAGIVATGFLTVLAACSYRAWRTRSLPMALIAGMMIMVIAGFSTHLVIKMRPYNVVPALPYKVTISVAAFTLLIAYLTMLSDRWVRPRTAHWAFVSSIWISTMIAAITRPGMQIRLLSEVGLVGLRDPLTQIIHWFR